MNTRRFLLNSSEITELRYRKPMQINEIAYYVRSDQSYPKCPRCGITMEREYQSFCDRCGQRLDWSMYHRAMVTMIFS